MSIFQKKNCKHSLVTLPPKKIVLTGGPGAGKTAILELAKRQFCKNVLVIPEAATIVFGGGFMRFNSILGRKSAQRSIYYIQREYERLVNEEHMALVVLCDRGTVDGAAYWPGSSDDFYQDLGILEADELSRYDAVIHLRSPALGQGFNHQNPLRVESAQEAAAIDACILKAWSHHPKRSIIDCTDDFMVKANLTLATIQGLLPPGCAAE